MINLVWKGEPSANRWGGPYGIDPHHLCDLRQIRRLLHKHNYTAKYIDIHDAWEEYSHDDYASGWLYATHLNDNNLNEFIKYLSVE